MKQKIFLLLGIIGLVFVIIASIRLLGNKRPKEGELRVDAQPSATIFLNNKNIGKTPYKEVVAAGQYTIKLVPESGTVKSSNWEGNIQVGQNLLTYVNASLQDSDLTTAVDVVWLEKITSSTSELAVTTSPDGATVFVDDQTKGVTPLAVSDISAGDHTLNVTSAGFRSRTIKIKTTAGYRLIANLKLALVPGGEQTLLPSPTIEQPASASPSATPTKMATSSATVSTDPAKPYVVIEDTPTGFLRVRLEPNTSASEAGKVRPGEKYSYSDSQNGWYQIRYDGANTGWVSGQYVKVVQ